MSKQTTSGGTLEGAKSKAKGWQTGGVHMALRSQDRALNRKQVIIAKTRRAQRKGARGR